MPIEIWTMLGSSITGFVMKFWASHREDRAEQERMKLERMGAVESSLVAAREYVSPNVNWIRRFIVVAILSMLGFIVIAGVFVPTNVPVITEGLSIMFGIVSFPDTTEFIRLEGLVAYDWLKHAILAIISFYFGQGAARK